MDPLTAIATALIAGAAAAMKDTAVQAIKDGYNGMKGANRFIVVTLSPWNT